LDLIAQFRKAEPVLAGRVVNPACRVAVTQDRGIAEFVDLGARNAAIGELLRATVEDLPRGF